MLHSAKGRLWTALGLLLLLALGLAAPKLSTPTLVRWVLGLGTVAALVVAWHRSGASSAERLPPAGRLEVHARTGLSPRCGLALVEVDGERFLVAFGEGFATLQRASRHARGCSSARADVGRSVPDGTCVRGEGQP